MTACQATVPIAAGPVLPDAKRRRIGTPDGVGIALQDWSTPATVPEQPGLLLLHGYSQSHLCWWPQVTSALAREFHLVTYDLRGHGDSDKPLKPALYRDARHWADEVHSVITAAGLTRPVVVAWSYAGRIILDYLSAYGDDGLAGLVMAAASSSTDPSLLGADAPLLLAMADPDRRRARAATRAMLGASSAHPLPPETLEYMVAYNEQTPWQVRRWLRNRPGNYDAVLRGLTLPTLVIHGARDTINRPAMAAYTASRIRGARTLLYPDVGHLPFWEAAQRFNADVSAFVRECTARVFLGPL